MRFFGAILIAAVLVLSIAGSAAAKPPMSTGKGGKQGPITPPPRGVSQVIGVVIKSEQAPNGGTRTITMVLTGLSAPPGNVDADMLLYEPFEVSCPLKDTDVPPGYRLLTWCHVAVPQVIGAGVEGSHTPVGIVGMDGAVDKFEMSAEPDFDLMKKVLEEAMSAESRSMVVDVLIGLPGKRSSRTLVTAVYDLSLPVRLKAARELIARNYEPAIEKLTAMLLGDIESELTFQVDLAEELAAAGHKEGTDFLLRHTGDDNPGIAIAAIRALARTGGADEAASLKALAESAEDEEVAKAAKEAAEEIEQRLSEE
jgi:hypothetical protein